jgi:hypothetical protein
MMEGHTRRLAEAFLVCLEPRYEFLPARARSRHVFRGSPSFASRRFTIVSP